jgi:hypothetical protein
MKHARSWAALALAVALTAPMATPTAVHAAGKTAASAKTSKKRVALHQFTGIVTAYDKTSITVEKGGKTPKTMVFARHAEMSTQGDLARDAKVTVFYREEDGKPVARKVVVKSTDDDTSQ